MEEKYKIFENHNWSKDEKWQLYYNNIYPTPKGDRISYIKKKYYKLKIDNDFDINYQPKNIYSNNTENKSHNKYNYNYSSFKATNFNLLYENTLKSKIISSVEAILFVISCILIFIYNKHALKFSCFTLLFRIYRRIGIPKFNMEYAQTLFLDEHVHCLMLVLLFMIDKSLIYVMISFFITSLLNVSEYCRFYKIAYKIFNSIVNKRVLLSELRSNSEIIIGFMLIIGVLLKLNNFIIVIFYWQYLRFKYIFSPDCASSFKRLNEYINKHKKKLPNIIQTVISKIQELFSFLGRTEANKKTGEKAGGANCLIF